MLHHAVELSAGEEHEKICAAGVVVEGFAIGVASRRNIKLKSFNLKIF